MFTIILWHKIGRWGGKINAFFTWIILFHVQSHYVMFLLKRTWWNAPSHGFYMWSYVHDLQVDLSTLETYSQCFMSFSKWLKTQSKIFFLLCYLCAFECILWVWGMAVEGGLNVAYGHLCGMMGKWATGPEFSFLCFHYTQTCTAQPVPEL